MGDKTKIEWADATLNFVRARNLETQGVGHFCEKVSDECSRCYAARMQRRFRNDIRYNAIDRDKVDIFLDEKVLTRPLRWQRPRLIFPCSMTDLFGDWVKEAWLDMFFAVAYLADNHVFQCLTKRKLGKEKAGRLLDGPRMERNAGGITMIEQPALFETSERSAFLSRDRIYRYTLWRRWNDGIRYVNFICINPSTADESSDDPTVRKCVKFARSWGYDALCITNLFAYRSTDIKQMKAFRDPVGLGNNRWLRRIAEEASLIVCAWGRDGVHLHRSAAVRSLLDRFDLHYLRITMGEPWHPLYLPDNTRPSRWYRKDR